MNLTFYIHFYCSFIIAKPLQGICILGQSSKVKGTLILTQHAYGVRITGKITGLSKGKHGFHVHKYGDESDGCIGYGGHWNPFKRNHGEKKSSLAFLAFLVKLEEEKVHFQDFAKVFSSL